MNTRTLLRFGASAVGCALVCIVVCSCMRKFDTGSDAFIVRPYIKDGHYTDGTLYYDIEKNDAVLIGTKNKDNNIVIPDAIGVNEVVYPLTKIQNLGVFDKESYETSKAVTDNDNLTSLTIGVNVRMIDKNVFFRDSSSSDENKDGNNRMRRFAKLEYISVRAGNTTFDSRYNCNAIIQSEKNELLLGCKHTVVPNGVTKISAAAFRGCEGLKEISLPSTLHIIGPYAFSESHLEMLNLPSSTFNIGRYAFYRCDSLISISLHCNGINIEKNAFQHCSSLKVPESEVRFYNIHISVLSPEDVFDNGCNRLLVPKGCLSSFEEWKKCFHTIQELN